MNKDIGEKDLLLGCECRCMNHISRFDYHIPTTKEEEDDEYNVIYFTVTTENLFNSVVPPIRYCYDLDEWMTYFRWHIFNRIGVAFNHIFNLHYAKKDGILNCFDFMNKDLPALHEFLTYLSKEETKVSFTSPVNIHNERLAIRFSSLQIIEQTPWGLGWEPQFINKGFWRKIKDGFKYIFGMFSDEQSFEITKKQAATLKGLITSILEKEEKRINEAN